MGSTRLAGKILKPIMGRPMLSYLIERLRYVKMPHSLILASTTNPIDDELEAFAKMKIFYFFAAVKMMFLIVIIKPAVFILPI